MATNNVQEKWDQAEEDEDEEEALSLSDLPVTLINHENQQPIKQDTRNVNETQEEFNFKGGLFSNNEPEMCVADEVFFQGKILPLRHSCSSEASYGKLFSRSKSRSQSLTEFRSNNSSRSSSIRSQSSSTSSSTTHSTTTFTTITPKIRNQFHTHPSPKPQLKLSSPTQASFRKSSVWGIFRLGVVSAPEIGLQDLKVRSSVNKTYDVTRNSSSSSDKNESVNKRTHHHVFKHFIGKGGGLLSGCDCTIETVQSGGLVMNKGGAKSNNMTESTTHAMKEKVVELKKQKQKQRKKQSKKVMSRRRTFEWLKELHASHPDEEALLSNPS